MKKSPFSTNFLKGRYSPRLSGVGKQVMKQISGRGLIRIIMTSLLKEKIRKEFNCTDEDIEVGIQAGITDFGKDFRKMLDKQQIEMTPPKEDDNDGLRD